MEYHRTMKINEKLQYATILRNKMLEQKSPTWKNTYCVIILLYKVQVWMKLVCGVKCQDNGYSQGGRRDSDWKDT